jgi:hypothetical protein
VNYANIVGRLLRLFGLLAVDILHGTSFSLRFVIARQPMVQRSSEELREFHRFVGTKLQQGGEALSPEDVLDEWRDLVPEDFTPEDSADAIRAVREALAQMEAGDRGKPAREILEQLRARLTATQE